MFEEEAAVELDDAGVALQLLACTQQIRQGAAKLAATVRAGEAATRAGVAHNWMEYEHCRNALGQLIDNTRVCISEPYQAEADAIHEQAVALFRAAVQKSPDSGTDALIRRARKLYKNVQARQREGDRSVGLASHHQAERSMSDKLSVVGSYLIGTDVLINFADVVGHRGGGWHRAGGGWIGPGGQPVFPPPGEVEPVLDFSEEDLIGELETLMESDWGAPGAPIMTDDDGALGKPIVLVGGPRGGGPRGGGPRGGWGRGGWGRGWGRGGFGWGYPWGPPLDYGYTVVQESDPTADLAIAEAIQRNTELQQKLHEKELAEKDKRADKKAVVGKGASHGGARGGDRAQGFYRGGWFGGDYPEPFAYYGPYESVDTALDGAQADAALTELLQQNAALEQELASVVGSEDFDSRMIYYTGKMRGGLSARAK